MKIIYHNIFIVFQVSLVLKVDLVHQVKGVLRAHRALLVARVHRVTLDLLDLREDLEQQDDKVPRVSLASLVHRVKQVRLCSSYSLSTLDNYLTLNFPYITR